jgi:hypothetical protein
MSEINCPACAGPDEARKTCATCQGIMKVSQETYDTFIQNQQKQNSLQEFVSKVQSFDQDIAGEYLFDDGNMIYQYSGGIYSEHPKNL